MSWETAFTDPAVPHGMKAGVSTAPWGVSMRPRRAGPDRAWMVKGKFTANMVQKKCSGWSLGCFPTGDRLWRDTFLDFRRQLRVSYFLAYLAATLAGCTKVRVTVPRPISST